jgi:hypothetical protein
VLIFVFARISYGLSRAILAEFGPVPNAPSDVETERLPTADIHAQPLPVPMERAPVELAPVQRKPLAAVAETGGPSGPEPTRFGDWERNGRCIDF